MYIYTDTYTGHMNTNLSVVDLCYIEPGDIGGCNIDKKHCFHWKLSLTQTLNGACLPNYYLTCVISNRGTWGGCNIDKKHCFYWKLSLKQTLILNEACPRHSAWHREF